MVCCLCRRNFSTGNIARISDKYCRERKACWLEEDLVRSWLNTLAGAAGDETADRPGSKVLPATIPRDREIILPQENECPACRGKLKPPGESDQEQPDIINTAFRIIETVRPKLACSRCDSIVQALPPPKPLGHSYANLSLKAGYATS